METWIDISYTQKPKAGYAYMKHVPSGECKWVQTPAPVVEKTSTKGKKK